jgi:alpha-D-ribose 1-methylphosphonate 5-triphosphate synthase subunit PhnG
MPETLRSTYDILLNQLKQDGKIKEKTSEESKAIMQKIEDEMKQFRMEKQKKVKATEADLSTMFLTA